MISIYLKIVDGAENYGDIKGKDFAQSLSIDNENEGLELT